MIAHRIDEKAAFIITEDFDQSLRVAEELTNNGEFVETVPEFSIDVEDGVLILSFLDECGVNTKIAITEADRLRHILMEKHPEMDDEEIAMRLERYKEDFDADFEDSSGFDEDSDEDSDEEGLISEEEANALERELEEESELEESEGLMSFADELKYMFENQGQMVLRFVPTGALYEVKQVRPDGLAVLNQSTGKMVLLRNETLDEREDKLEIL